MDILGNDDGTKEAWCECNGQQRFKGTMTFSYAFAKMLDHTASLWIFWAIIAVKNLFVTGADTSNELAEASATKLPFIC